MSNELIDWDLCLSRAMNNIDIAREMLDLFLETLPDETKLFLSLFKQRDFEGLKSAIHRLHGASCYTGIPSIKQQLALLERRLEQGETLAIEADFTHLISLLEQVTASYDKQAFASA